MVREVVVTPDAELVARIRVGDESAFAELFRAHYSALHRFAVSLVRTTDGADDVVQEVLTAVWAHRAAWEPSLPIAAYLFRAVRNRAIERLRHDVVIERAEAQALRSGDLLGAGVPSDRPDTAASVHDLEERLAREILQLPERQRTVILLRWHYDLNAADISRVLDISGPAVRKLLAKAETKLRTALGL